MTCYVQNVIKVYPGNIEPDTTHNLADWSNLGLSVGVISYAYEAVAALFTGIFFQSK